MNKELKKIHELCKEAGSWPIRWPDFAIKEPERCLHYAEQLVRLKNEYTAGDPIALTEAVKLSWDVDFFLPHWAHGCIADALTEHMDSKGNKSLDSILRFQRGRGRNNDPFKRRDRLATEFDAVFRVCELNKYLGFSLPVSFLILSKRGIHYAGMGEEKVYLSPDRIKEIYKESKRKLLKEDFIDFYGNEGPETRLKVFTDPLDGYAEIVSNLLVEGIFHAQGLQTSVERSLSTLLRGDKIG